jgi:hypothetical protein
MADPPLSGPAPNMRAEHYWLSGNGRYVVFDSRATNLVPGTPGVEPGSDTGGVYRRDNQTGKTVLLRAGARFGPDPSVSRDLRFLLIKVPEYRVLDRTTNTAELVAVDSNGAELPGETKAATLSANGRFVALQQWRTFTHEVTTYIRDLQTDTTKLVTTIPEGPANVFQGWYADALSLSQDGSVLAQGSCVFSAFLHGNPWCLTWSFQLVDVTSGTVEEPFVHLLLPFQARLNGDGSVVVYRDGPDVYAYNRFTHVRTLVDVGWDGQPAVGYAPSISASGRYVAFESMAENLVPGVTLAPGQSYVYVRDLLRNTTTLLSTDANGVQHQGSSAAPVISADGRYVTFLHFGPGLTPDATTGEGPRLYTKAAWIPRIASVLPASGMVGGTVRVTVTGYAFRPDASVSFHRNGTSLPTANPVVTETSLQVDVSIPANAPVGAYDVSVYDPGGGPGPTAGAGANCAHCFDVTPT